MVSCARSSFYNSLSACGILAGPYSVPCITFTVFSWLSGARLRRTMFNTGLILHSIKLIYVYIYGCVIETHCYVDLL